MSKVNLTDQEKDLLKLYVYVYSTSITGTKFVQKINELIWVKNAENVGLCYKYKEGLFKELENEKMYSLFELGIEENNG